MNLVERLVRTIYRMDYPEPSAPAPEAADVRDLVAELVDMIEADTRAPRPAPVVSRPEPVDVPYPMTDPGRYDKPYARFMAPGLDPEGPFGHVPGCRCGPSETAPSATCGMPAWAALTDEEKKP